MCMLNPLPRGDEEEEGKKARRTWDLDQGEGVVPWHWPRKEITTLAAPAPAPAQGKPSTASNVDR